MDRQVVVTGVGVLSPVGLTAASSWKNALAGESGVGLITKFDTSDYFVKIAAEVRGFDPMQFMDSKQARRSSRFVQFAVAAAAEALNDSGHELSNPERVGCSIGVGIGSILGLYENSVSLHERGPKKVSPFFIPYTITNMAAGVVAIAHGLKGPNICPSTACTSGTHAIGEAFMYIKNGMADAMLCGGSEAAVSRLSLVGFGNMKALSKNNSSPKLASRPFDKDRDGFVLGEGAGLLMLEEYQQAKARGAKIYAHVLGYGMSCDAHHITAPAPEGEGAARCMAMALESSKLEPTAIDHINAHGTSTYFNDINESTAIANVFGHHADKIAVSSTKGVTGHCLGGAGGIEAAFLALAIRDSIAPITANLENADPECPLDYVKGKSRPLSIRAGLSNSFGFGGTNGTLIFASDEFVNR